MFVLSKIVGYLADPAAILLFLLLAAGLLHVLGKRRASGRLFLTATILALVVAIVPVGPYLTGLLEDRIPAPAHLPDDIAGIIVLGGAIEPEMSAARGQISLNSNVERIMAFAELARRYPDARLIFTGGSGDPFNQRDREADAAANLLPALAMDTGRIAFERESRNTYESARNTFALARPRADENWILITSARHMPRAAGTFRTAGWRVLPYPVDYTTLPGASLSPRFDLGSGLRSLRASLREWVGLAGYYAVGRTGALFPESGS